MSTTVVMNITVLMSNRVNDARVAMASLIESRALTVREDDPNFPAHVADLAWRIADAMSAERAKRSGSRSVPPPPSKPPSKPPSGRRGGR